MVIEAVIIMDTSKQPKTTEKSDINLQTINEKKPRSRHSTSSIPSPNLTSGDLRHTQSHIYSNRSKIKIKKAIPPPIPETEQTEENGEEHVDTKNVHITLRSSLGSHNERRGSKIMRMSGMSQKSNKSTRSSQGIDNAGFDGEHARISRTNSVANSIRSSRPSSIQSVQIEQYCWCSRFNKCERILMASVSVLVLIVIVLIVVVALLSKERDSDDGLSLFNWKL